jgi:hypothetical protein
VDEISELNRFYQHNKDHNVMVFGVNYDARTLREQQRLVAEFDIHYPGLQRTVAKALHLGSINVVPVTFVLNPQGALSTTLYGGQTVESLHEAMS